MESSNSSSELQKLVEAIKISEVVEGRTELIAKLADLHLCEQSDVQSLAESLTTFWEDSTCLDVSQCLLNKTILHVAAKYLESDVSGCLLQFLPLGTKASMWCGKHLKMTVMSTEESEEEEHCSLFYQLLLDFLSFSAAGFATMTRYSVLVDGESKVVVEKFILEQLNLIKDTISEIKNMGSVGVDVLKDAQAVIDAVIRLCKEYLQVNDGEFSIVEPENNEDEMNSEQARVTNYIMNITTISIEKLFELGILAANDGGRLVTVLNVSWKGMVTLLQLVRGKLRIKVNIANIIVTLTSIVNDSLKCAAEAWSSSLKDTISVTEARRVFVPIKFYLMNAVKVSSLYPCQAYMAYKELTLCVLMISSFKLLLSHEAQMKNVSEVMTELLEKSSLDLLSSLLISADVKQELRYELLDLLFSDDLFSNDVNENPFSKCTTTSMSEIFSLSCEDIPRSRVLLLGRVVLFSIFLRYSFDFEEDVKLLLAKKLGWFMNIIIDEEVYSSILVSQIPVLYVCGKTVELTWEPMFLALLNALKTFMIVISSTSAWEELGSFLVTNFMHPHFLCSEIIMELWGFLIRHAEIEFVKDIIAELCALMKLVALPESVFIPDSSLRKMARSICVLLTSSASSVVDCVYNSVVGDDRSQSPVLYAALLLEGFPLTLLSKNTRSIAKEKIVTEYFGFIDGFEDKSMTVSSSEFGFPVCVLSTSLQLHQVNLSDIDMKILKFLVAIVCGYRNSKDKLNKEIYCKLLSPTLGIISNLNHLYASEKMEEVILELHDLFVSGSAASDTLLNQCKPGLALFMAGICNMGMSESDNCAKSSAIWGLYHMLLRERHWASVHLSIAAFGFFAARTTCNQLWKFVPHDAALSYDLVSGNNANEERFMSEFKAFLEKEIALPAVITSSEQKGLLLEEGKVLKQKVQKFSNIDTEAGKCDSMEVDYENQPNKRRKLPDGVIKGVELLENGFKLISDSLSHWKLSQVESSELHENFITQVSSLENVISHLVGLSRSV